MTIWLLFWNIFSAPKNPSVNVEFSLWPKEQSTLQVLASPTKHDVCFRLKEISGSLTVWVWSSCCRSVTSKIILKCKSPLLKVYKFGGVRMKSLYQSTSIIFVLQHVQSDCAFCTACYFLMTWITIEFNGKMGSKEKLDFYFVFWGLNHQFIYFSLNSV